MKALLPTGYDDARDRSALVTALAVKGSRALQVVAVNDGEATLAETPSPHTVGEWLAPPAGGWKAQDIAHLAAHERTLGRDLVEVDLAGQQVLSGVLTPFDRLLRERVAQALGVGERPWEVALTSTWVADPITRQGRLDRVEITRMPLINPADKRTTRLAEIAQRVIPGGSTGWTVEEDTWTGTVKLVHGYPAVLPERVPLESMLPDELTPSLWHELPLGLDPQGRPVYVDLLAGPHCLFVGPTGSGKTVGLLAMVTQALLRGHELVVVDPTKAGLDFLSLKPYCSGWADTVDGSRSILQQVYAEVERRKALLQKHGEVKWSDLSEEVRRVENVQPLTVLIDETSSLFIPPDVSILKHLGKEDPERLELEEQAAAKAMIKLLAGKLAREARFAGIHLEIATQRPDANILGGELRSNLTSAVQLSKPGAPPNRDALAMVFAPDQVPLAFETLSLLDDGTSRGLAITAAEGGSVQGMRVAYAPMRSIPALLEARGVEPVEPRFTVASTENLEELDLSELNLE